MGADWFHLTPKQYRALASTTSIQERAVFFELLRKACLTGSKLPLEKETIDNRAGGWMFFVPVAIAKFLRVQPAAVNRCVAQLTKKGHLSQLARGRDDNGNWGWIAYVTQWETFCTEKGFQDEPKPAEIAGGASTGGVKLTPDRLSKVAFLEARYAR